MSATLGRLDCLCNARDVTQSHLHSCAAVITRELAATSHLDPTHPASRAAWAARAALKARLVEGHAEVAS